LSAIDENGDEACEGEKMKITGTVLRLSILSLGCVSCSAENAEVREAILDNIKSYRAPKVQTVSEAVSVTPTVSPAPSSSFGMALASALEDIKEAGGTSSSSSVAPSVTPAPSSIGRSVEKLEKIMKANLKVAETYSPTVTPAPSKEGRQLGSVEYIQARSAILNEIKYQTTYAPSVSPAPSAGKLEAVMKANLKAVDTYSPTTSPAPTTSGRKLIRAEFIEERSAILHKIQYSTSNAPTVSPAPSSVALTSA
jgi:hypothetical protein